MNQLFLHRVLTVTLVVLLSSSPAFARPFLQEGMPHAGKTPKKELPDFSVLARALSPAVVNVSVETADTEQDKEDSLVPDQPFFKGDPQHGLRSVGSGFVVSKDGYLVTNNHVIENARKVVVRFLHDPDEYEAEIVGRDPKTDIALLKLKDIGDRTLEAVYIGDSDSLEVGEWVMAIGNQFQLGQSVTAGIVSALSRRVPGKTDGPYDAFIQTDASINPGSSGGPLFNSKGQVVGINTAIFSPGRARLGGSGFNIGIGFAIPINLARSVIEQLKESGRVTRGLLGVSIQRVNKDVSEALGLKKIQGALVAHVVEGSSAYSAGVKRKDIIIGYDGREVNDYKELPLLVANTPVGSTVRIDLIRDGRQMSLNANIKELTDDGEKADEDSKPKVNIIGLAVRENSAEFAEAFNLPTEDGIFVESVEVGSLAESSGFLVGDIIEELGDRKLGSVEEFNSALEKIKKGGVTIVFVRRKSGNIFLTLRFE